MSSRTAAVPSNLLRRCCRCNATAKCLRCSCARSGVSCSRCLPCDAGRCHNRHSQPLRGQSTNAIYTTGSDSNNIPDSISVPSASHVVVSSLPSVSDIMQAKVPTLQHVPKGARAKWAKVLSACLSDVCNNPEDDCTWARVFMAAKCLLYSPPSGHRLHWREILKLVKSRIDRWLAGDLAALWSEAVSGGQSLLKRTGSSRESYQRNHHIRRAKQAVQDGQYRKAIEALSSNGLDPPSSDIQNEMLLKHPQTAPPTLPSGPVPPPISLSESGVLKGARSFPKGSAPGPSGLRPSHIRETVRCPSPDQASQLLTSLTRFVNVMAAGRTPPSIIPHLCGASLLALKKKTGGHQPIAVGEVLRRLVSKCLANQTRDAATSILAPLQLGVGIKGGCEAIVHATSQLRSSPSHNQHWTLMLDFSNAFNSINREAMFVEFRRFLPGLCVGGVLLHSAATPVTGRQQHP